MKDESKGKEFGSLSNVALIGFSFLLRGHDLLYI
jgi:hypothetical protein